MFGIGAPVRLSTEVRTPAGALVNPATITLSVMQPDGIVSGPHTPVSDGVGLFHFDFSPAQAGRHIARWVTTSPSGVDEEPFDVAAEWAEAGIFSLTQAKKQLNIELDDHDDDEEIAGFLRSVTELCERRAGSLVRRVVTEKHRGGYAFVLARPPLLSLTSVTAAGAGGVDQDVADLDVDLETGIVRRRDGSLMPGPVDVVYVAGRTVFPANVIQAGKILLQHLWETQRGQMGSARVGGADEVYDPRFGFTVPRRVEELLPEKYGGFA
ncbi:hypothetical protein [Nonomuraea ceibae]|uniref:hypothetical protein n=1 Tax=Nonomuraea ceibae TaxID=1935170 RepID=UPI001C5E9542|nr:hypothetical protein [Nonomuraea ceibae]